MINNNIDKRDANAMATNMAILVHDNISVAIRKRGINNDSNFEEIENMSNKDIIPKNDWRKQCLYYIAGWLLVTVYKQKNKLGKMILCHIIWLIYMIIVTKNNGLYVLACYSTLNDNKIMIDPSFD